MAYLILFSNAGKELNDPRVLTDVGDVPVQEIRDCGVDDDRLMNVISESVKLVMEEVNSSSFPSLYALFCDFLFLFPNSKENFMFNYLLDIPKRLVVFAFDFNFLPKGMLFGALQYLELEEMDPVLI